MPILERDQVSQKNVSYEKFDFLAMLLRVVARNGSLKICAKIGTDSTESTVDFHCGHTPE